MRHLNFLPKEHQIAMFFFSSAVAAAEQHRTSLLLVFCYSERFTFTVSDQGLQQSLIGATGTLVHKTHQGSKRC